MKKTLLTSLSLAATLLMNAQSVSLDNGSPTSPACPGGLGEYYVAYYTPGTGVCSGSINYYYRYTITGGTIDNQTTFETSANTISIDSRYVVWNTGIACQSNGSVKVEVINYTTNTVCASATKNRAIAGDWSAGISGNDNIMSYGNYTYSVSAACGATSYTWSYPSSWSVIGSSTGSSIQFSIQSGDSPGTVTCTANTLSQICPASKSIYVNFSECLGKMIGQYDALKISSRMVSGDFDNDGDLDDIAAMYNYGGTTSRMHVWINGSIQMAYQGDNGWWASGTYDANKVKGFVSGDFDNDGFKDDIAAIYYYGNFNIATHVFIGNTSSFSFATWYTNSTYDGNKIVNRVVSGDFDSDGYLDDITAFYDYGNLTTTAHVWKGQGTTFSGPSTAGWWSGNSYEASKITGRVVSGDFDRDGFFDDITAFYDYGNFTTTAHVWRGQGTTFSGPSTAGWWSGNSYDAAKITGRVVSGDFDRDGFMDDIAAVYDYGNTTSTLHVWQSTGTSFSSPATAGWWSSTTYDANKLTYRMVSGEFVPPPMFTKKRHRYAIAGMYDYTCFTVAIHVWNSTNSSFSYQGDDGRWMVCEDCDGSGRFGNQDVTEEEVNETNALAATRNSLSKVYPNPSSGFFSVELEVGNNSADTRIVVMDVAGRIVEQRQLPSTETRFDFNLTSYPAGVYVVIVERDGQKDVHRLIIQE